jgi:hypothetical protein
MSRNASRAVAVPRMPHLGMRASTTSKPGISGVTRNAVSFVSLLPGTGVRAITVSTRGDGAVGDVTLLAIEGNALPAGVGDVGGGFRFGQGEGGEVLAADHFRQPTAFLLLGAEEQQGARERAKANPAAARR